MPDDPAWWRNLGPTFHAAIRAAEPRGRMSFRELDGLLPRGDYTSTQIEIVLDHLRRSGIEMIEDDCPGEW